MYIYKGARARTRAFVRRPFVWLAWRPAVFSPPFFLFFKSAESSRKRRTIAVAVAIYDFLASYS